MTDDLQQASSQQEVPDPLSDQPQKSGKNTPILVGVVIAIFSLCLIVCIAVFGTSMYKVSAEKAPVESVLDAYMRYMANRDAERAYALFSPRAQQQISISDVEEMLAGKNYFLFEGYQSLSVNDLRISAAANTNSDLPQGTVAEVSGIIIFEGAMQGSFNGVLEKVDGTWMIDGIYVTVPPNKIK